MPILLENCLAHLPALVSLWNACSVDPFWMDERLMRQYLERPGATVWVEDEPSKGALWARRGQNASTLDALLVLPECRRQGVGSRLLGQFVASLASPDSWRFGGGEHHFVPGLPHQLSVHQGFFLRQQLVADWEAHDLLWTSDCGGGLAWDDQTYRLLAASDTADLLNLLSHFGERWRVDTRRRMERLQKGSREEVMGAFHQGTLVGFCHIWSSESSDLGPSTFWLPRHRHSRWGGIGPLGVHPDRRGLGYGAGVVDAAMAYLRRKGAEAIGVDWTGLPEFYEGRGFRRWLTFRGYHPESGTSQAPTNRGSAEALQ